MSGAWLALGTEGEKNALPWRSHPSDTCGERGESAHTKAMSTFFREKKIVEEIGRGEQRSLVRLSHLDNTRRGKSPS